MGISVHYSGVSLKRAVQPVLNDIDLTVNASSFTVVIGANGAGKTTLLRATAQLLEPVLGTIAVELTGGHPIDIYRAAAPQRRLVRRHVGYISQTLDLVPEMSVLRNAQAGWVGRMGIVRAMRYALSASGRNDVSHALQALDLFHIRHRQVGTLSRGEKQRVALARLILHSPDLILADEPIASMDPKNSVTILNQLTEMNRSGATILCSLHQIEHALRYGDQILAVDDGRVLALGDPSSLTVEQLTDRYHSGDLLGE